MGIMGLKRQGKNCNRITKMRTTPKDAVYIGGLGELLRDKRGHILGIMKYLDWNGSNALGSDGTMANEGGG